MHPMHMEETLKAVFPILNSIDSRDWFEVADSNLDDLIMIKSLPPIPTIISEFQDATKAPEHQVSNCPFEEEDVYCLWERTSAEGEIATYAICKRVKLDEHQMGAARLMHSIISTFYRNSRDAPTPPTAIQGG